MADYTTPTGAGQLMIRDQGSVVEFWIYTPYSLFWNNLQFNVDANGTTTYFSINYNGRGLWVKVGQITVWDSQTITYRLLTRTNTTSVQGPTSMSVHLERGTVPPAPFPPKIWEWGSNFVVVEIIANGDGGRPIDIRQLGWGKNPGGPERYDWIPQFQRWDGLEKGTTYYFWGQLHNDKGWGGWSGRSQVTTHREPDPTIPQSITEVTQTSFKYWFVGPAFDGGTPVREWQMAYGTNPNEAQVYLPSGGTNIITGLQPATTYYVWSRGRNDVGWSPWSTRWEVRTIAGAWVKQGLIQKEAIPYVKENGVWKLARPWVKQAGVWKESQ